MRQITPGSLNRIIDPKIYYCGCVKRQQRQNIAGQNIYPNISTNMRISQIINTSLGGKIYFGNGYLGQKNTTTTTALKKIFPIRNIF